MSVNRELIARQMQGMSDRELRESLEWQEALADHGVEIGESAGGAHTKAEMLKQELERRDRSFPVEY